LCSLLGLSITTLGRGTGAWSRLRVETIEKIIVSPKKFFFEAIFFPRMTRTKPACRQCDSNEFVKTLGGGTHQKYRYACDNCASVWQEIPPHRTSVTDVKQQVIISKVNPRRSRNYNCGRCGQQKKGHICKASSSSRSTNDDMLNALLGNVLQPPSSTFQFPQAPSIMLPFSDFQDLDLPPLSSVNIDPVD